MSRDEHRVKLTYSLGGRTTLPGLSVLVDDCVASSNNVNALCNNNTQEMLDITIINTVCLGAGLG
jgi:hypothetical protein